MTSATETNVAAQQKLGELIGSGEIDRLHEVFADDVIDHDPAPGQEPGAEGIKTFWRTFLTGFPDAQLSPQVLSADDEHVTVVLDITGTHSGEFLGHPATGKRITVRGIQVGRFEDGKLVERWGATDELGILQQLGLLPDA
jgi:steroid delta-isomerase-like uncharacterized protein